MTICALASVAELVTAWLNPRQRSAARHYSALEWSAAFLSYVGACLFIATTNSPVQLISVAWLMWLIAEQPGDPASTKRPMLDLVALWTAVSLSWAISSNHTPIIAMALLGVIGTALSLSRGKTGNKRVQEQPVLQPENKPESPLAEQSWAQHDSILHDLSNAMTASLFMVRDLSRALDKGTEPGLRRARSLSQELVGELSQMGEHIKSSRQSVRLQPIVGATISLLEPVEHCVDLVGRLYPDVKCSVKCAPSAAEALVSVIGGESTLKRIVENLMINSCQAERAGASKEVDCLVALTDSAVVLTVEDNGLGFPKVVLESYPSPMVSTKAQGSGIGLYSCHQLVKRDGGTVAISNSESGGARVTISWPKASRKLSLTTYPNDSKFSNIWCTGSANAAKLKFRRWRNGGARTRLRCLVRLLQCPRTTCRSPSRIVPPIRRAGQSMIS